ncbi:hypothetical protein BDV95DRAFT_583753 [Massariosphaeria phaeospora]|uniref:Rhodopsin domain-containing protein n=1 Tax=Massariosphaeria phaeospora TaxID=100035 RepID=A0A7C8MDL7_9PLEO|nr:hypothetical protein BDV95DRAFT_583753 [Massariosphaeria phaeospora]
MTVQPTGPGLAAFIVIIALLVLATIAVFLRVWARYVTKAAGLDDYLMFFGIYEMVEFLSASATLIAVSNGLGTHAWHLDQYQMQQVLRWIFFSGLLYAIATAAVKASICVLLLRITIHQRIYQWILYSIIFVAVASAITGMIATLTACKPIAANWDHSKGNCDGQSVGQIVQYVFGAVCIAIDVACASLPVFILWSVQLSKDTKKYIAGILGLGVFASIATIVRMKYVTTYIDPVDFVYSALFPIMWSAIENLVGILAGCIATMRPVLRVFGIRSDSEGPSASKPSLGLPLHSLKSNKRSDGSKIDKTYQIIVEPEGGRKEDGDASDHGSQRRILEDGELPTIDKESEVDVKSVSQDHA